MTLIAFLKRVCVVYALKNVLNFLNFLVLKKIYCAQASNSGGDSSLVPGAHILIYVFNTIFITVEKYWCATK